ncbi:amidase [Actinomycetospora sp. TBRC 11914]|uniref:amidase n=1 Tax=Actinomycetospora sp. TBRC 11914 TaxID=2729387 RepID=UPI00145DA7B8|nr:amidase [Actinomycetospora sp. TBRC 11914]NMO92794.1 amidase [Actinomycetospora sp. TBRC 11914]
MPELHAVVTALDERPGTTGPLAGWRVGVKDNVAVAGVRSTRASAFFAEHVAAADATVVTRLRAAGAAITATLNMAEFALGVTSQNSVHGGVVNPWDPDRIPGGSSGGSGAAVAAGLVDAALGTDTGGSVRLPASMCGVTGLRPTYGTVPEDGVFPCCPETDATGPLTRTARDAALVTAVLAGREPVAPEPHRPAVVGILTLPGDVDPAVTASVEAAVRVFADGGATLWEVTVPRLGEVREDLYTVVYHDLAARHAQRLREAPERFHPDTLTRLRLGLGLTTDDRERALERLATFRAGVEDALAGADVLVSPTVPVDVPRVGAEPDVVALTKRVGELTAPWAVHRGPTLSVPVGPHPASGMPVGMQLTGRPGADDAVCAAGAWFQERTDWHAQRPPSLPSTPSAGSAV